MQSKVKVILRNPLSKYEQLPYTIDVFEHELGQDWLVALKKLLSSKKILEKNYCFFGFPNTSRNVQYLCSQINQNIQQINQGLAGYKIDLVFNLENIYAVDYAENGPNHELFNKLHNHFEHLQGTVNNLSDWYKKADYETKYAIRQINNLCHELETLILSRRKEQTAPEWIRPSQITTWINADRYDLKIEHKRLFLQNGYDRRFGGVYMHWTQIGKTLFEVFHDEKAPNLSKSVCNAITHLQYYSGEFDVEWGRDIVKNSNCAWHDKEQEQFAQWLISNDLDPTDINLSLGYLPIGQVNLKESFGTDDCRYIQNLLSKYLDIYCIEANGVSQTFDYCWTDYDFKEQQIKQLRAGYDYNSGK